jgi:hypothetical protein
MPRVRHAVSGKALAHPCDRNAASITTQLHAVKPNVGRGWSEPHLGLSGLLALLLRKDLCCHAVRGLSLLLDVLPSRLLCTLPGRRLLCASGALKLSEHLRRLMVTLLDADLEQCVSVVHPSSGVRSQLRQHRHRLYVPVECRVV